MEFVSKKRKILGGGIKGAPARQVLLPIRMPANYSFYIFIIAPADAAVVSYTPSVLQYSLAVDTHLQSKLC